MKQKVKAQVSFLDHSLSGIHRSVCLTVSVSLNKILSKKIIVPWDQLAEFWRFVYAYMYKNEREMFGYTWLNLPRLRLETYARFYQQRNFAWFLKLKKGGGGVLSLRNRWTYMYLDREMCKCILHWRSEFFSFLMKVAWLTNLPPDLHKILRYDL